MLLLIFNWLQLPAVFDYCSTRMALSALTSLLFVIVFGPSFIRKLYELKIGDQIRKEDCPLLGELHAKKEQTPTMGGTLILFSLLISLFLWMDLTSPMTLILLLTTVSIGSLGALDDWLKIKRKNVNGLGAKTKLGFQLLFSLLIAAYLLWTPLSASLQRGVWFEPPQAKEEMGLKQAALLSTNEFAARLYVPFYKRPLFQASGLALFGMAFFFACVITGSSNAVNLTDGLDGLATGTVMLAASAFALIAFLTNHADLSRYLNILHIEGAGEVAIFLSAVVGACLGFLWFNGPPAQVFMGDTGSLTLGAILGVSAVLLKRELLLVIIGGVFVVEALSVLLQVASFRWRHKKRVFLCAPLHHHFEYQGMHESKVVLRFWIVGLMFAIVGIATLKFQ